MLAPLFTWWQAQMRDLLPASLWKYRRSWQRTLVVTVDSLQPSTVGLYLRGRGRTKFLGRHGLDDLTRPAARGVGRLARTTNLALCIPQDVALERSITLPIMAETGLPQLLKYEMDRFSPLAADEMFWTAWVQARDSARNRLYVKLTMVPRLRLQAVLDTFAAANLSPACIEIGTPTDGQGIIALTPAEPRSHWLGPRFDAFAFSVCGMLAVVAVVLPFVMQSLAYARLDTDIAALRPHVARAEALRDKLTHHTTLNEVLTSSRKQAHTPLQVIATLTELIPDDTHLTSISLRQNKLTISGRSAAAARLIALLATHPLMHNPAFAAPVIRDETTNKDLFQIHVDMDT